MRYALKVYYDGIGFSGSQRQPEKRTVEGEFLAALERLGIDHKGFKTAGRTDKGVSALGNVFALSTYSKLIKPRILNSVLPKDIKVLAAQEVEGGFNPRHAKERRYRYFLLNEGYDLATMKKAAKVFIGQRSFHNFSSTDYRSPIRKINYIDVEKKDEALVLTFSGESFLWQMVRRIVTALKMAGRGELSIQELESYFDPDHRKKVPPSNAENLVLWDVRYNFPFKHEEYSLKKLKKELKEMWAKHKTKAAICSEVLKEAEEDEFS
ncbi:MAG: tRNA pseudouridine(38-40) synthase TruA [Candidatus Hydrothermarchaeales archaeon]